MMDQGEIYILNRSAYMRELSRQWCGGQGVNEIDVVGERIGKGINRGKYTMRGQVCRLSQ